MHQDAFKLCIVIIIICAEKHNITKLFAKPWHTHDHQSPLVFDIFLILLVFIWIFIYDCSD